MEQKEILRNNKIIAKFLDLKHVGCGDYILWAQIVPIVHFENDEKGVPENIRIGHTKYCNINNFKFHSSWDWLMKCFDKIENLPCGDDGYYFVDSRMGTTSVKCSNGNQTRIVALYEMGEEDRLTKAYKTILQFIKWYEVNGQKNS